MSGCLWWSLLVCLLPVISGYPNGAPDRADICRSMTPGHDAGPQTRQAPYKIIVDKDTYGLKDNVLTVTILSTTDQMFRGFMLQARRVHANLTQAELQEPVGYFDLEDGVQAICGGTSGQGNVLTHTGGQLGSDLPKAQLTVKWTATSLYGHIEFRATIVKDVDTYWIGEKSKVVMDPSKPLPDVPSTPPPSLLFYLDLTTCGSTKGCYRYPPECTEQTCEMVVTWENRREDIAFELSGNSDGWIAVGFSEDKKMGKDDVVECVWNDDKSIVEVKKSRNLEGSKSNVLVTTESGLTHTEGFRSSRRIQCRFHLSKLIRGLSSYDLGEDSYHLLMARGPVDHHGNKAIHEMEPGKYPYVSPSKISMLVLEDKTETARYPLVKVHACLMLIAWMMCASTAILMAKYYKPMWPNDRLCRERVWFAVHRGCQITNLFCTVIGFILIFIHVKGYSWMPELPAKAHPPLGIVTTILCILNPFIALCRCSPKSSKRPIFNWIHWFIGLAAFVLSTPTIFIGLNLPKAHVPWWATWVMVAFLLFHLIIELLLEIHGCMNSKKQKVRNEEYELRKKNDSRGEYYGLEPEPVGRRFKKTVLSIYLFVVIILGLVMIIAVAVG